MTIRVVTDFRPAWAREDPTDALKEPSLREASSRPHKSFPATSGRNDQILEMGKGPPSSGGHEGTRTELDALPAKPPSGRLTRVSMG